MGDTGSCGARVPVVCMPGVQPGSSAEVRLRLSRVRTGLSRDSRGVGWSGETVVREPQHMHSGQAAGRGQAAMQKSGRLQQSRGHWYTK